MTEKGVCGTKDGRTLLCLFVTTFVVFLGGEGGCFYAVSDVVYYLCALKFMMVLPIPLLVFIYLSKRKFRIEHSLVRMFSIDSDRGAMRSKSCVQIFIVYEG